MRLGWEHHRIMYGSDWPYTYTPEPLVAHLSKQLDNSKLITPEWRQAFMRENALRLFPRFNG